jgi:hypothetical protein
MYSISCTITLSVPISDTVFIHCHLNHAISIVFVFPSRDVKMAEYLKSVVNNAIVAVKKRAKRMEYDTLLSNIKHYMYMGDFLKSTLN